MVSSRSAPRQRARAVVIPSDKCISIRIANTSSVLLTLMMIAIAEPVTKGSINAVAEPASQKPQSVVCN